MVRHLHDREEAYMSGSLAADGRYRDAQNSFQRKYNRKISLSVISRIAKRSKKIKNNAQHPNKGMFCWETIERENRIIRKVNRTNRWDSY